MSAPRDTTKTDPAPLLAVGLTTGTDSLIEDMEAAGQEQMVHSTMIPTEMSCKPEALEAFGFKLGEVCKDEPMFRECELPAGWKHEGSSHSMWSYIVDEYGFRRCSIFYKAAFYDRRASLNISIMPETRAQSEAFQALEDYAPYNEGWSSEKRKDGDNIVHTFKRRARDEDGKDIYNHEAHEWQWTGEMREATVTPDGSVVGKREWTE